MLDDPTLITKYLIRYIILFVSNFHRFKGGGDPRNIDRVADDDDCPEPEFDEPQRCICGAGRKISYVSAEYNSKKKDRKYVFTCTPIPGNVGGFSGDSW